MGISPVGGQPSTRPFTVFPNAGMRPPPVPAPPPLRPANTAVTPEETEIRTFFCPSQDPNHPIDEEFIKYLAQVLATAKLEPNQFGELRVYTHDVSWHTGDPNTQPVHYYVLPIPQLKQRSWAYEQHGEAIPPPPRRAMQRDQSDGVTHVQMTHASTLGGMQSILTSGRILPSRLHFPDSESYFALGFRKSHSPEYDAVELSRIIHSSCNASKNDVQIIAISMGWGCARNVDPGGEAPCIEMSRAGGMVHRRRIF